MSKIEVAGPLFIATEPSPQVSPLQAVCAEGRFLLLLTFSFALCSRIKPVPYPTGSSRASFSSGSSNSFNASPEEPAYDGPSTSGAHPAPVLSSTVSYDPRKPAVKSRCLGALLSCLSASPHERRRPLRRQCGASRAPGVSGVACVSLARGWSEHQRLLPLPCSYACCVYRLNFERSEYSFRCSACCFFFFQPKCRLASLGNSMELTAE